MTPAGAHVCNHLGPKYEAMPGDENGLRDVVMRELDDTVGKVLGHLETLGVGDETIVVFTSDSGPETKTWPDGGTTPFPGEKGTIWEVGSRVPAIVRWPGKIAQGQVSSGIFSVKDWMLKVVAAAGGPDDPLEGYDGYRVHLDGFNQLSCLTGTSESPREELIFFEGADLLAVCCGNWTAHFAIESQGWAGAKEELNAPLVFNLRRVPYETATEETGMYTRWMGNKMWAFGPAARLGQQHLSTFADIPPRRVAVTNQANVESQISTEGGMSQSTAQHRRQPAVASGPRHAQER